MKRAYLLLHISILLASLTGIFGKLIHLNEVFITFYRMLLAGSILLALGIAFKQFTQKVSLKEVLRIGGVGFLLGLHWIFFYGSIKYANVSVGVVCFSLTGFFTAILTPVFTARKMEIVEVALSLLTLFGIGLIFSFDPTYRTGIILGIISSLIVAIYTLLNEKLTKQYPVFQLTAIEMSGGAIGIALILPIILHFYPSNYFIPFYSDLIYLILLAGICTVLMYLLINRALAKISAFTVNLSFNLEPIYTIIIAAFLFQEYKELSLSFYVGLGLILFSLALQMYRVLNLKKK